MTDHSALEKKVIRIFVRVVFALVAIAVLAYPADWAIWHVRVAFGGGMDTVSVGHFTVANLKGNKQEYYVDGTNTVDCSKSLFPEAGSGACWWVRRHADQMTVY
jgi:hypothetical protein